MKKNKIVIPAFIVVLLLLIFIVTELILVEKNYYSYKDFYYELENDKIESVIIENEDTIKFKKINDDKEYYTENPNSSDFKEQLLLKGIIVQTDNLTETVGFVLDLLFYLIFFGAVGFGIYKLISLNSKTFKVVKKTNVKFEDIAGMDDLKKEMLKAVEILKSPKEYEEKGIRQIKGIILEGNPGNGKTLFAKALAGETDVKFIATKGADFQSAMMSMGARKIKMLFKKARKNKPCIIFIDEFDGIGERRNYAGTGVDKENNRIITAMLNEMDGFNSEDGILVIAATNSYSSLDPALIRPGRFDLKYNISNPDYNTRIKLIELYTKKKVLNEKLEVKKMADAFDNLSSAAIESIINEASMLSILENKEEITVEHIIVAARKTNCNINLRKLTK